MLKKMLYVACLFFTLVLYALNSIPFYNVEVTYGKGSNCIVKNAKIAMFYDSVCATKSKDFNYQNLVEEVGATLQFVEDVNGVKSFYYYSPKISKVQILNGKKVNLHVAVANNYIKIGSPFICGGY